MGLFKSTRVVASFRLRHFAQAKACGCQQGCWNNPEKRHNGFTLLELLIVIALMAILWGVAYTMFYQSKKVFSLSSNKLEMYQHARIAMDGISRDLEGATLKDNVDFFMSPTNGLSNVKGNSSILTFLALTSNGSSTPVTLVTYYLKDTDELMRAEYNSSSYINGTETISSAYNNGTIDISKFAYYKLAANMNYFNLTYITGSTPVSTWDSTSGTTKNRLPNAVKVTLQTYGTGTGNMLEIGTFTTQIALPYRVTH